MTEAEKQGAGIGAVSPEARNVGEGYKKAAYEAEAPKAPPGFVPGLKFFLERFGHMMSRFVLTILYAVLIAPVGLVFRLFSDPLMTKEPLRGSSFTPWQSANDDVVHARRQG
ncbi:MAG: hypothetical protein IPH13_18530 [Planctomycetes bacterium]|nr:hypothetical protein [Planctomycetota bacterium]MCC7169700.1 hypothetical protein [Planctomycetota bacterium]